MLTFWYKLCNQNVHKGKLSRLVYNCLFMFYKNGKFETLFNEIGLSSFWLNQGNINESVEWFKNKIKRSLIDKFLQSYAY
jgi:hypothetical protein